MAFKPLFGSRAKSSGWITELPRHRDRFCRGCVAQGSVHVARFLGLQLGLSASPQCRCDPIWGRLSTVRAARIAYEYHFGDNHTLRIGEAATASGTADPGTKMRTRLARLHSANVGVSLVLAETWFVGLSASYEYAAHSLSLGEASPRTGIGGTASLKLRVGSMGLWRDLRKQLARMKTLGRGLACSRSEVGGAYRLDTQLKFYTSIYGYDFRDDGVAASLPAGRGAVFLGGVRAQL